GDHGRPALLADELEHAAIAEVIDVVPDLVAVRAVLAVARDRAVDEARVARREGRVVDPEALRDAGPEALEHDVCAVDQAKKDLTPRLALEIQRHAALVASEERDADAERIVGCGDREHLHAEVGEHGGAE